MINRIDKIIAFIGGDIAVTLWISIGGILKDLGHFGLNVLSTIIIGLAGGFAALAAKDLYPMIKKKFKLYYEKKFNKKARKSSAEVVSDK